MAFLLLATPFLAKERAKVEFKSFNEASNVLSCSCLFRKDEREGKVMGRSRHALDSTNAERTCFPSIWNILFSLVGYVAMREGMQ